MKESHLLQVAQYAVNNGLAEEPAFAWWVPHAVKKWDRIIKATGHKTDAFGTDYVPTIGMKITKDFGSKGFFEGEVTSGPHSCTVKGDAIVVWKVRYEDGDREEMTASEIAC